MSGLISALPCFCELVATWLGCGGQAHIMDYKVSSHTRFESGRRHHFSALPLPLESVLPAQVGVALPHLVPLAPVRRFAGQARRGRLPRPERRVIARAEPHGRPRPAEGLRDARAAGGGGRGHRARPDARGGGLHGQAR